MNVLLALALLLPQAPTITPCADGSAAMKRGDAALAELTRAFAAAAPASDAGPLLAGLKDLLAQPCLALAAEHTRPLPDAETPTPALLRWWRDGGREWLASYLQDSEDITLPPDVRKVLTKESAPKKHALAPLLCSASDATCGAETRGWARRAEIAFGHHAAKERRRGEEDGEPTRQAALEACWTTARKAPAAERYQQWRACVDTHVARSDALPLGALRAPTDGWFVLRGRRGHYGFCDEVRVFGLATGAAYVVKSCSRLALRTDGKVDGAGTAAGRKQALELGSLPADNLREAAWLTMLAAEAEDNVQVDVAYVPRPKGLKRQLPPDTGIVGGLGMSSWAHSGQTTLSWTWIREGAVQASGTLTWPDSAAAAVDHAARLIRIAEAGLQPGCPPTPLPRGMVLGPDKSGVSPIDASAAERREVDAKNVVALRQLAWDRCKRTGTRTR